MEKQTESNTLDLGAYRRSREQRAQRERSLARTEQLSAATQGLPAPSLLRTLLWSIAGMILGIVAVLCMNGCGRQAYVITSSETPTTPPGSYAIPAKVDILMAEDDMGSIDEAYPQIAQQLPVFLQGLQSSGWDYHFANIPLTTPGAINQAMASVYDTNWGSQWQSAYPGERMLAPGQGGNLAAAIFRMPSLFSAFLTPGQDDVGNEKNGVEPGFQTILQALQQSDGKGDGQTFLQSSQFMRPDALFVVIVLGNGEDTSGVQYCPGPDGNPAEPCAGSAESSYQTYLSAFKAIKPSPAELKFYSLVSFQGNQAGDAGQCLGGTPFYGDRYIRMAGDLGGQAFDVCSQPISASLSALSGNLQATRLDFVQAYLFMSGSPNPSSIQVTKYVGGNTSQAQAIPQDPNNGWTYAGYVNNVYTIVAPFPMDQASGYAVQLHGSALLTGGDTATVTFKPAGAQDSNGG